MPIDQFEKRSTAYPEQNSVMAPSNISPGSAATVLSFPALASFQLETRFRVGKVLE